MPTWHDRRVTDAANHLDDETVPFPRLYARTQRFTLGEPRNFTVTAGGRTVLFIRTADGTSRSGLLWAFDVESGTERVLADPSVLLGGSDEDLSPEERARRERAREAAGGIVSYSVDDAGDTVAFALSGRVWTCAVDGSGCRRLPTEGAAIDPHIDPTGRAVAYASGSALRVIRLDTGDDLSLAESEADTVVWGQAEFVAAEEMDRSRGFWWAPDGSALLVERYDESPVPIWYIADPAHPETAPTEHRYPAAGSADAVVELWLIGLDNGRTQVVWDAEELPYLARVSWMPAGGPVIQVVSRDHRRAVVLSVDPATGATGVLDEVTDPAWVELVVGVPALAPGAKLVTCVDDTDADTRRIAVDGVPVSPPGLQIRDVLQIDADGVLATASDDPVHTRLIRVDLDGTVTDLSGTEDGTFAGRAAGGTDVVVRHGFDRVGGEATVRRNGIAVGIIENRSVDPGFRPAVTILRTGEHDIVAAILFPAGHVAGSHRLPVLMAPYGGPHGQLVRSSARMFLQAQWLADQGFVVVVADGRGTPGRGPRWEKAIRDEFGTVSLDDQVAALSGVAERYPDDVDTGRVGILGWSYGGYLAALAVLRRPDVFHAAVAGAPVTDWTLYDTYYTENYLGHPSEQPDVYERNSLIALAPQLRRPLLIVHGMVDDNVVVAHTLRLSSALLAAGRPHAVLPLTGVTHMTPQEVVAQNLLLTQVDFLQRSLLQPATD